MSDDAFRSLRWQPVPRRARLPVPLWPLLLFAAIAVLWLAWCWGVDQRQLMGAVHLRGPV